MSNKIELELPTNLIQRLNAVWATAYMQSRKYSPPQVAMVFADPETNQLLSEWQTQSKQREALEAQQQANNLKSEDIQ